MVSAWEIMLTFYLHFALNTKDFSFLLSAFRTTESLENRIEHYAKKRRIEVSVKSNDCSASGSDEPAAEHVRAGTDRNSNVDHGVLGMDN